MNKEEFNELQKEFADYVYRYEYFLKCGYLNDLYYNQEFKEEIKRNSELEFENSALYTAINEKQTKPDFDLDKYLEFAKGQLKLLHSNIEEKQRKAEYTVGNSERLTVDQKKDFEKEYLDVINKYHPVVRVFVQEKEKEIYNRLRAFYNNNDIAGFKEFLDLNKNVFAPIDYADDTYTKVAGFYYQNQKSINADYTKKVDTYPYNKAKVLTDDIAIARERAELSVGYTKLTRDNQSLKAKFKEIFGTDFAI